MQLIGKPESSYLLGECAVYLARAPKSREVADAMGKIDQLLTEETLPGVPIHLRNPTSKLAKDLNYGKGYVMGSKDIQYLPDELKNVNFFKSN